ncbi:DNA-binding transcriptional regulator, AcrR family [Chitinophaga eiseniae]|uniref:DNA-binding transcriptional regulator, AcrR family n=1 Tax=Chitinophaga eiseniae TaxID=634771 RepID=A0A1T4SVW0_9BACT|nr:TetR/AcrR family transcriptional regulator [Chitinophaga eiseniae]SKA32415.1 DNA-binding transcriptional regulator, AcrR family [Chitinophaga eiseniae]
MRVKDEQKAALIREKAIEMIVREGFDGLSMHKLAKAVDISVSTIYIYFKNREDLLNQLYIDVMTVFVRETLLNFDPDMDFEAGLWLQWSNRYRYIRQYPLHYQFTEQFRNSPLILHPAVGKDDFKQAMVKFNANAVRRQQIVELPTEVYWALAYGPFYTLVNFHLHNSSIAGKPFKLSEALLKQTFERTIIALKK